MKRIAYLTAILPLLALLFLFASPTPGVHAQEFDPTCSDGVDNDGDGLIDLFDPDCTTLSEEPTSSATAEPTVSATDIVTATPEPTQSDAPTPTAVVTPSTVPPTGGDPHQGSTADQTAADVNAWDTEQGGIGALVSFVLVFLAAAGYTLKKWQSVALVFVLTAIATVFYVSTRTNLAIDSPADIQSTGIHILEGAVATYILVSQHLQGAIEKRRANGNG